MRKLRLQMQTQLFNGAFQPVIGGDLLCLARLDGLQAGQNDFAEEDAC
jgi:hypothetical protein